MVERAVSASTFDVTCGTRTPTAPVSVACWIPVRSCGPPTLTMVATNSETSHVAVRRLNVSLWPSAELTVSRMRKSQPHAPRLLQ